VRLAVGKLKVISPFFFQCLNGAIARVLHQFDDRLFLFLSVPRPPAGVTKRRGDGFGPAFEGQHFTFGAGGVSAGQVHAGGESAGYPTICKGRYLCGARNDAYYAFEEPVSLNLSALLPDLMRAGVTALKIEGRQRSRAYVRSVVSAFRNAVDDVMAGRDVGLSNLLALTEGSRETQGAYRSKTWR